MLSNLASYLGYQLSPAELESDVAEAVNVSAVEEDEWLLVERLPPTLADPAVSETVGTCPSALPGARSSMQESWYLTPPPSFSPGPVHVVTSPLENLLIEHPSMSVYQKSSKCGRRKVSNSSRSTSEEHSEEGSEKPEKFSKVPRNKYSKKTSMKRATASSSDEAPSLPSASEDEEKKEVKMINYVRSPRRSLVSSKGARKTVYRRSEFSSSDEMISVPSFSEEEASIRALINTPLAPWVPSMAPPKKLYSDVVRMEPRPAAVLKEVAEEVRGEQDQDCTAAADATVGNSAAPECVPGENEAADEDEGSMVVEEPTVGVDKDRLRAVQLAPGQQRQAFLNRSAQKLEQRKTCELAKRSTMGRNNKAREINSRNKRQRRSDMMQRHSGVNNNRKCC